MFRAFFSLAGKRGRWLVTLVGLASFAASFSALIVFATGWAAAVIPTISETVLNATLSAVVAQFAMSLTSAVLIRHLRREIEQMHTAIDSMALHVPFDSFISQNEGNAEPRRIMVAEA